MTDSRDEPETFFGKVVPPVAPDTGEPLSFGEVFDAVTPPGANKAALLAALKAAQRTGGQLPGSRAPDISGPADGVPDIVKRAFPAFGSAPEPEDPFTPGDSATIAIADTYFGLIDRGVPVASVERIIGIWLGALPGSSPEENG
jgi:hypothetical protein